MPDFIVRVEETVVTTYFVKKSTERAIERKLEEEGTLDGKFFDTVDVIERQWTIEKVKE